MMQMKRNLGLALAGLLALGTFALAQNADQNTAGPTRNDLRLRLSEPAEGAQISGTTVRVAVDYNRTVFGEGQGTKFGDRNFPMPLFDVYLDNSLKQTLKGGESNVAVITDVPAGAHKVVVVAKNISGEIIDRAVVNVTNSDLPASTASTSHDHVAPAPPPAAAPASISSPAPAPPAPAYTAPSATAHGDALPKTASDAPATAFLGLSFLASGVLLAVTRRGR